MNKKAQKTTHIGNHIIPASGLLNPTRIELDQKREELQRCYQVIEELIQNFDVVSKAKDKLDLRLENAEEEKKHLWNEIEKLRHGYHHLESLKDFYKQSFDDLYQIAEELPSTESLTLPNLDNEPRNSVFKSAYFKDESIIPHYYSGLDVPESGITWKAGEMIHIGGWCFDHLGKSPSRVWVSVGKQEIPCSAGWARKDVIEEFNGTLQADLNCGFNVQVKAKAGLNRIKVCAEFQSGAEIVLFHRNIVVLGSGRPEIGQLDQDYSSWVEMFDTLSDEDESAILAHIQTFQSKPLISILLPTYNTDERWLSEAIESVRSQLYENWELCIADDASPKPHVRSILEYYAKIDKRIKVCIRSENGHISAATNSALEMATGSFCALLDHDDALPDDALYHVALELNEHPDTNLIFSDEDKIDEQGQRFDPYFKSDWNPELFCSHNCISHLGVYRTSILREIDGFKEELFGSQDWDLAFRFIEQSGESGIRHIPRVLYHWRYLESSTAMSIESKPYAVTAGKRAIENYLKNKGVKASVLNGMWPGAFRVKYHIPKPTFVSIIIDHIGDNRILQQCLSSLDAVTEFQNYEVILTHSKQDSIDFEMGKKISVLELEAGHSLSKRYNKAAKVSNGEVLVFLRADTVICDKNWLEELISQALQKETGVVAPWLQFANKQTHTAGIIFTGEQDLYMHAFANLPSDDIGHMGRAHLIQRYRALEGVCLATQKSVFNDVGGFAEGSSIFFDFDYCLRLFKELGLYSVWTPYAHVTSRNFVQRGEGLTDVEYGIERNHFYKNWKSMIVKDCYFNPNLSLTDSKFFLAWPPRNNQPWNLAT